MFHKRETLYPNGRGFLFLFREQLACSQKNSFGNSYKCRGKSLNACHPRQSFYQTPISLSPEKTSLLIYQGGALLGALADYAETIVSDETVYQIGRG